MSVRFTQGQILEVPLPSDYQDQACLPIVILQPTADATNYMLRSNYATNGQPGIVDKAVLAETVEILPQHGPQHIQNGNDPIPDSNTQFDGLCPAGDGNPLSYLGGDRQNHSLPPAVHTRSEGPVTLSSGNSTGSVLLLSVVPNLQPGIYLIDRAYLYNWNKNFPISGMVHFEVYDANAANWVAVTASTDISQLSADTSVINALLLSSALVRVWTGPASAFQWRLVLDTPGSTTYFQAGMGFSILSLTALST
jgi:hypothetical protein